MVRDLLTVPVLNVGIFSFNPQFLNKLTRFVKKQGQISLANCRTIYQPKNFLKNTSIIHSNFTPFEPKSEK
jgi:hypothetical protein